MIEETGIWQRGFGADKENRKVRKLVASLENFRDKAAFLTSKIVADLPHLTLHDISHLDTLWEVADIIVGEDFPLNPLEAYVFGGAVLLHDAALCFEAYSGGRQGLRDTVEWKDAYARLSSLTNNSGDISSKADFEALRYLHASQARDLACKPWQTPSCAPVYLIEDSELRENYGLLIGKIASSHHWDVATVAREFSIPRPPAAFLESDWIVDPLKIACMLRAADAGHIDGERAPSFLMKLIEMNSLSRAHWVAQNHLGRAIINPEDSTQLIIGSTSPFSQNEATAWWVAFDAIALFDKELRSCNELLGNGENGSRLRFARQGVTGAGRVKELTKHVQTEGWEPTDTEVHVSDVAGLIQRLGGAELYGTQDQLEIVIRELVQNSTDAIAARRKITQENFEGRVTVRLFKNPERKVFILQVDDDGIGMSQQTLTEDLMDFGKSFWQSARASQEFPGIHASGYSSIGRFGIGFFSTFMIANQANVFSRRFDKSLDSVRCLSFENGLSLRPTLSKFQPENFGMGVSTRIEIELKGNVITNPNQMEIRANLQGHQNFCVTFRDYVAAIVSGIEVRVFVEWDGEVTQVHGVFPPKEADREEWLKTLSYVKCSVNAKVQSSIADNVHRLREIRDGEKCYGLAAINYSPPRGADFLSAKAVGGLVSPHDRYDDWFIGLIDHFPRNAKREAGEKVASVDSIKSWLEEQVSLLKQENLDPYQSIRASYSLCEFEYDPIEIFQGIIVISQNRREFWNLNQIPGFLEDGNRLGFRVANWGPHLEQHGELKPLPDIFTCCVFGRGKFNDVNLENGVPKNENSLIGVIHRKLVEKGHTPNWITTPNLYSGLFGSCDCLEVTI